MSIHPSVVRLSKHFRIFLPVPCFVAGMTYLLTLSHSVYPGYSTALTAAAAGLIPPSNASHPLFALMTRSIASLDVFSLPVRLNLFSALCGTLCSVLLYQLVGRMILFSACEDAGGAERADVSQLDDEDESTIISELSAEVTGYNRRIARIAMVGGLVAAFAFVFTVPAWAASTRLDNGMFDLLIALASITVFPTGYTRLRDLKLLASVFLFTLGLFESAVFLMLLPCYAFLLFRLLVFSPRRIIREAWIILAGGLGTACSAYAYWRNVSSPSSFTLWTMMRSYARALPAHHYHELLSFFPREGWLLLVLQIGLPAVILVFGQKTLFKEKKASTVIALSLLTFSIMPGLLNLSVSPFFVFHAMGHLPVFGAAVMAIAVAAAFSVCRIILNHDDSLESREISSDLDSMLRRHLQWTRGLASGHLPILLLLVLATPLRSYYEANARRGEFADRIAREMLVAMKERTCMISNGALDNHFLLQAFMMNKPLTLITLRSQAVPSEIRKLKQLISSSPVFEGLNRQRLQNSLSISTVRFVLDWFNMDHNAGRRAMVFATPDIWTACGYRAIPEGLAFGGIPPDQTVDVRELIEQNRLFEERVSPSLASQKRERGQLALLRGLLRSRVGFAANELGVLLEEKNEFEAAYQSYARAVEIDPVNISAIVNGYALASLQGLHPEAIDALRKRVKAALERPLSNRNLTGILQNYGSIRQQAFYEQQTAMWSVRGARAVSTDKIRKALALSKQTGTSALIENALFYLHSGDTAKAEACYLSALEADASNADALSGMCTLMIVKRDKQEAQKWIQKALAAGLEKDVLQYPIITLAILKNDTEQALTLLKEATKKWPTDSRYWTLLADLLLARGDTQVVEFQLLPEMQKALKTPNHFMIHAIRGFLLRKKGQKFYKEARLSLLNALALNASLPEIWNVLFELDMAINNPEFTEADARSQLNIDPDHAFANYLMGSFMLTRGALKESEDFLRRSLEKKTTAEACNNLAENLRLQKRLPEAEVFARRALETNAGLVPAIDTLACVLFDVGKYGEASQSAAKAVAAEPNHAPYQLTLLRAQVRQGDKEGVKERMDILAKLQAEIPEALRHEVKDMK